MISLEDYRSMQETVYLVQNSKSDNEIRIAQCRYRYS